jgi:hypothetical protein
MKLKRVTITGADEAVTPEQLGLLTDKYPLVEWALLFSKNKQGQSRYPGEKWLKEFEDFWGERDDLPVAAHLCGQWTRDFVTGEFTFDKEAPNGFISYGRVQVNMTDDTFMSLDFQKLLDTYVKFATIGIDFAPSIILQTKRAFQRSEWLALINKQLVASYNTKYVFTEEEGPSRAEELFQFQMLYDVSGGKGKQPKKWHPPAEGVHCGYAGGIGPANVVEILKKIGDVVGETPFWIDMESRVRDESERFDITKVESVLEQVHTYLA